MKVALVTGTRERSDALEGAVAVWLSRFKADLVIHGDATGADEYAASFARGYDSLQWRMSAPWDFTGKAAGPLRNAAMVAAAAALRDRDHEVRVIAFPAKSSRGTWDCVRRAQKAGLDVQVHSEAEEWGLPVSRTSLDHVWNTAPDDEH